MRLSTQFISYKETCLILEVWGHRFLCLNIYLNVDIVEDTSDIVQPELSYKL